MGTVTAISLQAVAVAALPSLRFKVSLCGAEKVMVALVGGNLWCLSPPGQCARNASSARAPG